MPVPTHFRFTVRGHFGDSDEGWSFGFHFGRAIGAEGDATLEDVDIDAVASAVATYLGTPYVHQTVIADDVRCYIIGTDGKMEGNGPKMFTFEANAIHGGGANAVVPPQLAAVITLVADDRGPGKLGRWFLPGPTQGLANDMRWSVATATTYAQQASAFLKNVSDAIDLPGTIASASAMNVSKGPIGSSTGTIQQVDHVEVGRVLDTMRSRRAQLVEDRVADAQIDW